MNTLADRFWAKVELIPFHECWEWKGAMQPGGYGHMRVDGRNPKAHRVSYELLVGPIPAELVLDHRCRNRACVNPGHLEPVTQKVNVLRGDSKMARDAVKTHCHNGHELSGENVRTDSYGRHCVPCARKRDRDRYALKRKR